MTSISDTKLILMLQSNDDLKKNLALTNLYKIHFRTIAAFIEKNNGKFQDAEDIFQDGMTAFYEQVRKGAFKGASSISTYLFAICKNLWMKRLRKKSANRGVFLEENDIPENTPTSIERMISNEESEAVADLVEQLGENCQKILLLYYFERNKMKEIASIMNFANEQVAKNKKSRCLGKLKLLASKLTYFKSLKR